MVKTCHVPEHSELLLPILGVYNTVHSARSQSLTRALVEQSCLSNVQRTKSISLSHVGRPWLKSNNRRFGSIFAEGLWNKDIKYKVICEVSFI